MKMKKFELAIYDLDGTLLDTSIGVLESVKYTINYFGLDQLSDEELISFIGPPIQNSFAKKYKLEGKAIQEIASVFRDRYKNFDLLKAVPYSGIFDSLERLKENGLKLAVATYKREDYAIKLLQHFGFDKYFDVLHGADHDNVLKKSDIVKQCMTEILIQDPSRVVLIGDTVNDEIGAKTVGIDFIGVAYGFGFRNVDLKSKTSDQKFAQSPLEVANLILH